MDTDKRVSVGVVLGAAAGLVITAPLLWLYVIILRNLVPGFDSEVAYMVAPLAAAGGAFALFEHWAARQGRFTEWRNRLRIALFILAGAIAGQMIGQILASIALFNPKVALKVASAQTITTVVPCIACAVGALGSWAYALYPKYGKAFFQWYRRTYSGAVTVNAVMMTIGGGASCIVVARYNLLDMKIAPALMPYLMIFTLTVGAGGAGVQGFVRVADDRNEFWPLVALKYALWGACFWGVLLAFGASSVYGGPATQGHLENTPYLPAYLVAGCVLRVAFRFRRTSLALLRRAFTDGPRMALLVALLAEHAVTLMIEAVGLAVVGYLWFRWVNAHIVVGTVGTMVAYGLLALGLLIVFSSMASTLRQMKRIIAPGSLFIPKDRIAPGGRRTATLDEALGAGRDPKRDS